MANTLHLMYIIGHKMYIKSRRFALLQMAPYFLHRMTIKSRKKVILTIAGIAVNNPT